MYLYFEDPANNKDDIFLLYWYNNARCTADSRDQMFEENIEVKVSMYMVHTGTSKNC